MKQEEIREKVIIDSSCFFGPLDCFCWFLFLYLTHFFEGTGTTVCYNITSQLQEVISNNAVEIFPLKTFIKDSFHMLRFDMHKDRSLMDSLMFLFNLVVSIIFAN